MRDPEPQLPVRQGRPDLALRPELGAAHRLLVLVTRGVGGRADVEDIAMSEPSRAWISAAASGVRRSGRPS